MKKRSTVDTAGLLLSTTLLFAISLALGVPIAEALGPFGSYQFRATQTCLNSTDHFNFEGFPLTANPSAGNFSQTESLSGTATFNPNGTGSLTGHSRQVNLTSLQGFEFDFSCTFTWTAASSGKITLSDVDCPTITQTAGNGAGATATLSIPGGTELQVVEFGAMLVGNVNLAEETSAYTPANSTTPFISYRLCTSNETYTKVGVNPNSQ